MAYLRDRRAFGNIGTRKFRGARFGDSLSPRFSGLLDQYGGAAAAYAPLALTKEHVSDLPTVYAQRDSDEALLAFTQQEIINGDLETWAGAGNAYVYTYYDQSGTGNDLTQATRSRPHKIVDTGILIKQQDSVACVSTGTSYYDFDSAVTLTDDFTVSSVVEYGVGGNGVILGSSSANNPRLRAIKTASQFEILNGTGEVNISTGWVGQRARLHYVRSATNTNALYKSTLPAGNTPSLSGTFSFTRAFARNSGIDSIDGKIQALVIWNTDQTANLSGIDSALEEMLKKPKEIYIMLGQSNMVGRAVDGTTLTTRANDGNLLARGDLGGTDEYYGRFLDYYPSGTVTGFGPNVGIGSVSRSRPSESP